MLLTTYYFVHKTVHPYFGMQISHDCFLGEDKAKASMLKEAKNDQSFQNEHNADWELKLADDGRTIYALDDYDGNKQVVDIYQVKQMVLREDIKIADKNWPFENLELTVRAYNVLLRSGKHIRTIGDLTKLSEDDILAMKHANQGVVDNIKEQLGKYGLSLKEK